MYTLRDIQQEEAQIEKYLEIDKLPPGLHKRMKELDDRRKSEVQSRQSEREDSVAEDIRRADTPIDKLSFSMWNSLVPDQEPTNVRRHKHLRQSVQREDQEAIFDPECLDRDPFMTMARKGPGHRPRHNPVAGGILHHPSGAGRKAEDRPRRSSTPLPEKAHRLPRSMTPGWEGSEIAPGQRGTTGTLLWRVSGQANNLKKNADTEYWDHYSRYMKMKNDVAAYNQAHGRKV